MDTDSPALGLGTRKVLDFIAAAIDDKGYAPSIRDIGRALGMSSTNGVRYHLSVLIRGGWIERDPIVARGMRVTRRPEVNGNGHIETQ